MQSKEKTQWDDSTRGHDGNTSFNAVSELSAPSYRSGIPLMNKTRVRLSLGFGKGKAVI